MAECPISFDSSSEELADYFMKNCKLSLEEKEKFIKEGISGDVLLEAVSSLRDIGIKPSPIIKIKNFLKNKEEKFKPKEITEKISISNEEDIKSFFEKYLDFKGDLTNQIKGENELMSLSEEDMKKIGLNFGQRIRLIRYINYFKALKSKKDITITITKDSNEQEAINFLKNELNFCENSIEESGLDAQILFDLTEENLNDYSEFIKPEEIEMLKKFIKKRDEIKKKEEVKITKNSSEDDIIKYIKEELNIDIEKQSGLDFDLNKYEISEEEKKIIKNFVNEKKSKAKKEKVEINENNQLFKYSVDEETELIGKIGNLNINLNDFKDLKEVKNIYEIKFSLMKKSSFQKNGKCNVFFMMAINTDTINKLSFATLLKKGKLINFVTSSYVIFDSYLINIQEYDNNKGNNFSILLFQVISEKPINKLFLFIKDKYEIDEIYESEITIKNEANNYFVFKDIIFDKYNSFSLYLNSYYHFFSEYLEYFFDKKNNVSKAIQRDLIKSIRNKINKNKNIEMSSSSFLLFLKYCGEFSIEPEFIENIKLLFFEKKINKDYYITNEFITNNFDNKFLNKIFSLLLKIFSVYDIDYLLEMISSKNDDCCKIFFNSLFSTPVEIRFSDIEKKMNEEQMQKLQNNLFRVSKKIDQIILIINMNKGLENILKAIYENLKYIIPITDKIKKNFNGLMLNNPDAKDNIESIFLLYNRIREATQNIEYKLLNFEDIFEKMIGSYQYKPLDEYCKLKNFLKTLKITPDILEQYYLKIHFKGMELIKGKIMKNKDIIDFITNKDIYYYKDIYCKSTFRDPNIFYYIQITDEYDNYKENIQLIKKHSLYKLYDSSITNQRLSFYAAFLYHIKKLSDFNSIFEIFPINHINKELVQKINEKMKSVLSTVLNEKEENYENCYNIYFKLLIFGQRAPSSL